ncbi:MAG: hypothetical protein PHQ11_15675 [Paludibacter sp.]|nr:hypothetical protein [Paludibacter sp.]
MYKEKVANTLSDEKINEQKLEAKITLDQAIVKGSNVDDILEYLNELDQL